MRRCKVCKQPATMGNGVQSWCSIEHALVIAKANKERADKKAQREARARIKPTAEVRREAQAAFNAWIRERDHALPCISCGRPNDGLHQRHAGHYRSVGSNPALRFDPDNCHAQCATCNNHLSGNLIPYRRELIQRIGLERVERLEGPHAPMHYSRQELEAMKREFSARVRSIRKQREVVSA